VPIEALPLYTAMGITHEEIATSTGPVSTCVPACHQLAGALGLLGFEAEPMAAHVEIQDPRTGATVEQIGVRDEPEIYPDHTTNGHMVLWVEDFRRLADPTIMQASVFMDAARRQPKLGLPAVGPVPGGREELLTRRFAAAREPYIVIWSVFPEWSETMAGVLVGDLAAALDFGVLGLAHTTVELVRGLRDARDDFAELDRYPQFAALLSGTEQLPPLPDQPPAAFVRLRQAAGMLPPP
jgi:hypothetical protein